MSSVLATSILIAAVILAMLTTAWILALVRGWRDGTTSHEHDRYGWPTRTFYNLGWRFRRGMDAIVRRELREKRSVHEAAAAAFYAALDKAVQDEIRRKDHA